MSFYLFNFWNWFLDCVLYLYFDHFDSKFQNKHKIYSMINDVFTYHRPRGSQEFRINCISNPIFKIVRFLLLARPKG